MFMFISLCRWLNNIERSQLRRGSGTRLDSRWVEKIRKRNTFWRATLVILLLAFNADHVYVSEAFSMCNNIERSQLRRGSWNRLDSRWVEKIRKRNTFLRATLVILLLAFNEDHVYVSEAFSMCNNIERSQLRRGPWIWFDSRWVEKIRVQSVLVGIRSNLLSYSNIYKIIMSKYVRKNLIWNTGCYRSRPNQIRFVCHWPDDLFVSQKSCW